MVLFPRLWVLGGQLGQTFDFDVWFFILRARGGGDQLPPSPPGFATVEHPLYFFISLIISYLKFSTSSGWAASYFLLQWSGSIMSTGKFANSASRSWKLDIYWRICIFNNKHCHLFSICIKVYMSTLCCVLLCYIETHHRLLFGTSKWVISPAFVKYLTMDWD